MQQEDDAEGDIDLLVRLQSGYSLLDLGVPLMDPQHLLGREVDIVTEAGLRPRIRNWVLAKARAI